MNQQIGQILPNEIVDAFGQYQIGIAESLKGEGGPDDGRFQDVTNTADVATGVAVTKAVFLKGLVRLVKRGRFNFIEMHGFPQIWAEDDTKIVVRARVRLCHVRVEFVPREAN